MYQLLIVDDEVYAVNGIKAGLDWGHLGFTSVHTANNIRQAKELFEKFTIDVMICDIEMPNGSGLELLQWMKDHLFATEVIFLTNHADFDYAKAALKAGSFDYMLKPPVFSELSSAVTQALHKLESQKEQLIIYKQVKNYQQLFLQYEPLLPVYIVSDGENHTDPPKLPDMSRWVEYVKQGVENKLLVEIADYLQQLKGYPGVTTAWLQQFHQNFMQTLYVALQAKGIQAHQLFQEDLLSNRVTEAISIVDYMQDHVESIAKKAMEMIYTSEKTQSVVEKAKLFIAEYVHEDITRDDIANHVYLNSDYLTRVFKKETGISLTAYLIAEKMKRASQLLVDTDLPIKDIATEVGYTNFSHFSKVFKTAEKVNPKEYRKIHQ